MSDVVKGFTRWMKSGEGVFENTHIKEGPNNERLVISNSRLPKNNTVIQIELDDIIHDGKSSYYGEQLLKQDCSGFHNLKLALIVVFMLDDMRKGSYMLPYYKILPKSCNHFPVLWSKKTLSLLQGSAMVRKIDDRKKKIRHDYDEIINLCPEFKNEYTYDEFLFTRLIVGSRNFCIDINGVRRSAMVPYCDMLNHSLQPNVKWYYDNEKTAFVMDTTRVIEEGGEITDTYGDKCNSLLLLFYGFALPDNKSNTLNVHCIRYGQIDDKEIEISGTLTNDIESHFALKFFTFLRALNGGTEDKECVDYTKFISEQNECAMLQSLSDHMRELANKYLFTRSKIQDLIDRNTVTGPDYAALILIKGELDIIHLYYEYAEKRLRNMSKITNNI